MKKLLCLVLALILLLSSAALADQDNWVESSPELFVGAIEDLLFKTHNVTLTGEAHFSLNGDWFKTANGVYRQDGENSYWDYRLTAPGPDAGIRKNGYTIVANGEYFYIMESHPHPGTYKTCADMPEDTVLRKTVRSHTMMTALLRLANNAYQLLGSDAISVTADEQKAETMQIRVTDGVPDSVNLALTLFWQYAARRFLGVDTEEVEEEYMGNAGDYTSITKWLLVSTQYISLKKTDFTVTMDSLGRLEQIAGSASVMLHTVQTGDQLLDITFRLDVSDRGSTKVEEFRPEDYNVELYVPENDIPEGPDDETAEKEMDWSDHAYFSWGHAGYERELEQFPTGTGRWIGDCYFLQRENDEHTESLLTVLDQDGNLIEMSHVDGFDAEQVYTPYPDEQLVTNALNATRIFLQDRYPFVAEQLGTVKLVWWREKDGRVDFFFEQDPAPDTHSITMIIRALPEWHVELINCESNG